MAAVPTRGAGARVSRLEDDDGQVGFVCEESAGNTGGCDAGTDDDDVRIRGQVAGGIRKTRTRVHPERAGGVRDGDAWVLLYARLEASVALYDVAELGEQSAHATDCALHDSHGRGGKKTDKRDAVGRGLRDNSIPRAPASATAQRQWIRPWLDGHAFTCKARAWLGGRR